jgi:hypothetical protein
MKITLIKVDIQIKWKDYGWFKTFNENISIVVNKERKTSSIFINGTYFKISH